MAVTGLMIQLKYAHERSLRFEGRLMSPGDLNSILLLKIMKRLGDLRSEYTKDHTTRALFDLVPEVISGKGQEHTIGYLYQHLLFLQGCGLVLLTGRFCRIGLCMIELTAQGNMFVQPELA